jgi:hypothetical protein
MYLACTISLLLCYIAWTVATEQAQTASNAGHPNNAANIATLFFIYAYSPCYNIGYNALTNSELLTLRTVYDGPDMLTTTSQRTWSRFGPTPSAQAGSLCSSCLAVSRASSLRL